MLLPVHKITPPDWMRDRSLIRLLDTLNHDDVHARLVGGCIRNFYLSKPVMDIDIACDYPPEKTAELLDNIGVKIIPTGIKYGTVTAHIDGKKFEITTLRRDVSADGRYPKVEFSGDWVEDAKRRDFTINALYADRDGTIYDPTGQGFLDLQNRVVRFIGDPTQRIKEDYLRILRFFRFSTLYHHGELDEKSFDACVMLKDNLGQLSRERIFEELDKILSAPYPVLVLNKMAKEYILDIQMDDVEVLSRLISMQNQLNEINIWTRLYIFNEFKIFIKNNKINNFFSKIDCFIKEWNGDILRALYQYDREIIVQGLLFLKSKNLWIGDDFILSEAMNLKVPLFPIIALDIMKIFNIPQGVEVGNKLRQAEKIWMDSGFALSREEILKIMV